MTFEYIRAIAPSPARAPSTLAPVLRLVTSTRDETDLAELVAHALEQTPEESLACPTTPQHRLDLPRFSGITLADVPLLQLQSQLQPLPMPPAPLVPPAVVATVPASRMLLGPGVMTMMIAVVATLAAGVFVVTH
jgi:hypothetical protein